MVSSISIKYKYFYLPLNISLHTAKQFQVFLYNNNNVTSFIFMHTIKWLHELVFNIN